MDKRDLKTRKDRTLVSSIDMNKRDLKTLKKSVDMNKRLKEKCRYEQERS